MPDFITNSLPGVVIMLLAAILGIIGYRRLASKRLGELQEKVIVAQERRIKQLERENVAMRAAFRHLGIDIEIGDKEITLIDEQKPKRTRVIQVQIDSEDDASL